MSKIFINACKRDELQPGQMKRVMTPQGAVLLANVDGDYCAVDDLCTHEEVSLYLGCMRGDIIECSLHSGSFNLRTGEAVRAPAEKNLRTFQTRLLGEEVQIAIDAD
ncbi:MAG: non-heme iron oxygenase ferredoxin subunit [Gammaproteobacteria bacterium]|nr:non-heme iron oxygenase ferredoxin subunit [Gammaproteobacteria bacterium]